MKKISFMAVIATMVPMVSFAEINPSNIKLFAETGVNIAGFSKLKLKAEGFDAETEKTTALATGGFLGVGVDIDGIQLSLVPAYVSTDTTDETMLDMKLDIPVVQGKFQPYISLVGGMHWLEIEDESLGMAFDLGIGAGIKYTFSDNFFGKLGLLYSYAEFDKEIDGLDISLSSSSFKLMASIGYRF
jgi:opacity protein-like surface antigen